MNRSFVAISLSLLLGILQSSACDPRPPGSEPPREVRSERGTPADASPQEPRSEPLPDAGEVAKESRPEPTPEPTPEPPPEPAPEPAPEPTQPQKCQANEACNALLRPDGLCPGKCFPQPDQVRCRGTALNGLCYSVPTEISNAPKTLGDFRFTPGAIPTSVREGETRTFELSVTNTKSSPASLQFLYQVPPAWRLEEASFKDKSSIDFAANETQKWSFKVTALQTNVLNGSLSRWQIITFQVGRDTFSLSSAIAFPAKDNVACGSHYFPARYCPGSSCGGNGYNYYISGVCCDGTFYPGANCCKHSDCNNGGCFDGKCHEATPRGLSNTLSLGHQRILIVLSDVLDLPSEPAKICTNRLADLRARLKIDEFEAYFRGLSQKFIGQPGPSFQWVVYAGIHTKDFNPNGGRDSLSMHNALEKYLQDKGCLKSFDEYDKRLLISSMADIGRFTGKANHGGRLVMKKIDMHLFAHELLHTYGATDLYLNLGGALQYKADLMGNNLGQYGTPTLGVAWGEILWGDANSNGVIDAFEFAVYPTELVVTRLEARLTAKNSLEISADIAAKEDGVQKKIFVRSLEVELPDFNKKSSMPPGNTVVWDGSQIDLDAISKKGSVKVRLKASYLFTQRDFTRKTLPLDITREVKLSP